MIRFTSRHSKAGAIATAAAVGALVLSQAGTVHGTAGQPLQHQRLADYTAPGGEEALAAGGSASGSTGQMCVFFAPGDGIFNIQLGHVGWAFSDPSTGGWVLGSADGPNGQGGISGNNPSSVSNGSSTSVGSISGTSADGSSGSSNSSDGSSPSLSGSATVTEPADAGVPQYNGDSSEETVWVVRTSSFSNVMQDFESFGWYTEYRCDAVADVDASGAYTTAANDGSFSLIGNNCLNHAWAILNAYEPGLLKPAPLTPEGWFSTLDSTDGFGPVQNIPGTSPLDGGSDLPSGS